MSATDPRTLAVSAAMFWRSDETRIEYAERLVAAADAVDTRVQQLTEALELAAGLRHDMDNHSARYVDCEVPGCVKERAVLAEVDASPKEDA